MLYRDGGESDDGQYCRGLPGVRGSGWEARALASQASTPCDGVGSGACPGVGAGVGGCGVVGMDGGVASGAGPGVWVGVDPIGVRGMGVVVGVALGPAWALESVLVSLLAPVVGSGGMLALVKTSS